MEAATTTVYDVVTRYRVEDPGTASLHTYTRATQEAGRETRALDRTFVGMRSNARQFGTAMLGAGAAMGGAVLAAQLVRSSIGKVLDNQRLEHESSLQLASQIGLAFEYAADPIENYNRSLVASRGLIREILSDAARLPGESREFITVAKQLAGAVFPAGGGFKELRNLTGLIPFGAQLSAQNTVDAGRQAFAMLLGQAGLDRPLFAALQPMIGMDAATYNALPAARRLDVLTKALESFAGNAAFREGVTRTLSTQFGTLSDNLFGVESALGQVTGSGLYDTLVDGLVDLNTAIEDNTPGIVAFFARLKNEARTLGQFIPDTPLINPPFSAERRILDSDVTKRLAGELGDVFDLLYTRALASFKVLGDFKLPLEESPQLRVAITTIELQRGKGPIHDALRASFEGFGGEVQEPKRKPTLTGSNVVNHFTIKVDLKSDDSPEAVAVKVAEGMNRLTKRRTGLASAVHNPGGRAFP